MRIDPLHSSMVILKNVFQLDQRASKGKIFLGQVKLDYAGGPVMGEKPGYKDLEQRVRELESADRDLKQAEETIKSTESFAHTVLNSLSAHIAILDENGVIIETNRAWGEFARSNEMEASTDVPLLHVENRFTGTG
jgi:PAS domain-containing protein